MGLSLANEKKNLWEVPACEEDPPASQTCPTQQHLKYQKQGVIFLRCAVRKNPIEKITPAKALHLMIINLATN